LSGACESLKLLAYSSLLNRPAQMPPAVVLLSIDCFSRMTKNEASGVNTACARSELVVAVRTHALVRRALKWLADQLRCYRRPAATATLHRGSFPRRIVQALIHRIRKILRIGKFNMARADVAPTARFLDCESGWPDKTPAYVRLSGQKRASDRASAGV
jgi:hypothetical protein